MRAEARVRGGHRVACVGAYSREEALPSPTHENEVERLSPVWEGHAHALVVVPQTINAPLNCQSVPLIEGNGPIITRHHKQHVMGVSQVGVQAFHQSCAHSAPALTGVHVQAV